MSAEESFRGKAPQDMTEAEKIAYMAHAKHPLWCEFHAMLDCKTEFRSNDFEKWVEHHLEHMGGTAPAKAECWFEEDKPDLPSDTPLQHTFEASLTSNGDVKQNFRLRMMHIAVNHILQHKGKTSQRTDWEVVRVVCSNLKGDQCRLAMEWACGAPLNVRAEENQEGRQ